MNNNEPEFEIIVMMLVLAGMGLVGYLFTSEQIRAFYHVILPFLPL